MQPRRLRLGDVVDDYCPRERRLSNHVVVAIVDDIIKQTRCTTCDFEHPYKEAKVPARRVRKDSKQALYSEVLQDVVERQGVPGEPTAASVTTPRGVPRPNGSDAISPPGTEAGTGGVAASDGKPAQTATPPATLVPTLPRPRPARPKLPQAKLTGPPRLAPTERAQPDLSTSDLARLPAPPIAVDPSFASQQPAEAPRPTDAPDPAPSVPHDEGPVHRALIRATLPRLEGEPAARPIPTFTMRDVRPNKFKPFGRVKGGHPARPFNSSGFGGPPSRAGASGPRPQGKPGGGNHPQRAGNPHGNRPGRPRRGNKRFK
jgi:hypothetical protein